MPRRGHVVSAWGRNDFRRDATTHGGRVISGQPNYIVNGRAAAVVGDMVACPKKGHGVCPIIEGHPTITINGKPAAFEGCHTGCGAQLIASQTSMHHLGGNEAPSAPLRSNSAIAQPARYSPQPSSPASSFAPSSTNSTVAPGFYVVKRPGTRSQVKERLFGVPASEVDSMFDRLNGHLGEYVLPGSLVVLSDPKNLQCTAEEQALQDQARKAQSTVQKLEPNQAQAMINSWGAIADLDRASQATGDASTYMGVTSASLGQLKSATASTLDELAEIAESGTAYAKEQGKAAVRRIAALAKEWVNQPFEMPEAAQDLKQAIGVKADQALHSFKQAVDGIPEFRVPTISDAIINAGKIVKPLNVVNYLAIAVDYTSTQMKVENGCRQAATSSECRKIKFVEYGALAGRTGLGMAGGALPPYVCLAVGVTPLTLTCAIAAGGFGAYQGMQAGDKLGGTAGELIFDFTSDGGGQSSHGD